MQGVREPVFQGSGDPLPVGRVGQPLGAVGDVGQGAHIGQPHGERVDLAVGAVDLLQLAGHPGVRHAPVALGQVLEQGLGEPHVVFHRGLAEVRRLAGVPQAKQGRAVAAARGQVLIGGELAQRGFVKRLFGRLQPFARRRLGERAQQVGQRVEVQPGVAPQRLGDGLEAVLLDVRHQVVVHRLAKRR